MNTDNKYKILILLAEEKNVTSTHEKHRELNILLSELDENIIDKEHYRLLDDLICFLYNSNNVFEECNDKINKLQLFLRSA